jgi:hypothetical protein
MIIASAMWRRLDAPGSDACHLEEHASGWRLRGMAVFRDQAGTARLSYDLTCDRNWTSRRGRVVGWLGAQPIAIRITRTAAGQWTLNGKVVERLDGCVDLDFGFTPATNLIALRRLDLSPGQEASAPAAWLRLRPAALILLPQRYLRKTETIYWYEAPTVGYANELEVTPLGFVRRYPYLWELDE